MYRNKAQILQKMWWNSHKSYSTVAKNKHRFQRACQRP